MWQCWRYGTAHCLCWEDMMVIYRAVCDCWVGDVFVDVVLSWVCVLLF